MFKRKKKKYDRESIDLVKRIEGKRFSCVSLIGEDGVEHVAGRSGSISISFDNVVIVSDGTETFRCTVESARASELMSGNGIRIAGYDENGNFHKCIAIYNKF